MTPYNGYKIIIEKKAQKFLDNLPESDRKKIVLKIKELVTSDWQQLNIKKMQGYKNLYRLKIDEHRVILVIITSQEKILVAVIGHRKNVYDIVKRMPL